MNVKSNLQIIAAAQATSLLEAALLYQQLGFSVLPLQGKRPACADWKQFQQNPADVPTIRAWHSAQQLQNIGLVCGAVSGNLVVLDLDGAAGYPAFAATFPDLAETYSVATGGGVGKHVYWRVDNLPPPIKAMNTPIGNLEICAGGRQVAAPPSIHPITKKPYRVERPLDILRVKDLQALVEWIESFKAKALPAHPWQPPQNLPLSSGDLNPRLVEALAQHFVSQGYKPHGDWLHGTCIYPSSHTNGDRNPSFGFNTRTGYGYGYKCGTMLAKDICVTLGIRPEDYGGLMLASPKYFSRTNVKLLDVPDSDEAGISHAYIHIKEGERDFEPPLPLDPPPAIADLKLPNWLQTYLNWAGTTGNQTPMSFHLAAGLWLLAVAVGRRLYGEAPWGIKIYPNLYLMLIASTTYYRKSTAYKLAEQIARNAIPHMLMPTPGSPERFQEALSGMFPANFDKLSEAQRQRLKKAEPFAAQRGLLKDEVAGLFGTINKRDYMTGMKDLLMELYDCPDYSDKDTQTGLTIVENAALSILGVTTPASLSAAVSDADWANGLLIRFALLTPEQDYQERPPALAYREAPLALIEGLGKLHEKLPQPQRNEEKGGLRPPEALRLNVQCWDECQAYSEHLRRLCNPNLDTALDERLKGVYGRMHVQAFKLASLIAALDWVESDQAQPTVTLEHWETGKAIAEIWRDSAAHLLHQMDRSGEAVQEQRQQSKLLTAIRQAGEKGRGLRELYRALNLPAKRARQLAQDLVKAGLIVEHLNGRAEWYVAAEFTN